MQAASLRGSRQTFLSRMIALKSLPWHVLDPRVAGSIALPLVQGENIKWSEDLKVTLCIGGMFGSPPTKRYTGGTLFFLQGYTLFSNGI